MSSSFSAYSSKTACSESRRKMTTTLVIRLLLPMMLFLAAVQVSTAEESDCSHWPNSTALQFHFFQCDTSEKQQLKLHDVAITNYTGDDLYPVAFSKPFRVFLDVTNENGRRYFSVAVDALFYRRYVGWFGCGWTIIPSFGYHTNKDYCADGNPSCPIQLDRQILEAVIDPSPLFSGFFSFFLHNDVPYQVILRFRDSTNPVEQDPLLCVVMQTKIVL